MKIENYIALKYLKGNNKNKEISSISKIVILIISISIIFFISALSIMNGYISGRMKIQFEITSSHVTHYNIKNFLDCENILKVIRNYKNLIYTNYYRETKALLSANGKSTGLVYFRSIPEDLFEYDKGLNNCIKLIDGEKNLKNNNILISKKTKEKLKLKVGDYLFVTLISHNKEKNIKIKMFRVSGIFTTGFIELDENIAFINDKIANNFFDNNIKYSIYVKLNNYKKTFEYLKFYKFYDICDTISWEEENYNEFTALKFEKNIIGLIVIIIVFVAILNIIITIYITILEKKTEIGILKAIGFTPKNIVVIFLLNGIYYTFSGLSIGIISGLLIMNWLNEIMIFISNIINFYQLIVYKILNLFINIPEPDEIEIFSKDFYLDKIYTEIYFIEIIIISFFTLIISSISSLIPSLKTIHIKPNEVIKNG